MRFNRLHRHRAQPLTLRPSRADVARARIREREPVLSRRARRARGDRRRDRRSRCSARRDPDKAACFEDQYLSTGGQLYELMAGHDRFIADIRPLLQSVVASRGLPPALCCHPYDICTALIARSAA